MIPTTDSESRIALLLTSSSLARSLIRILLIRLFVPPDCLAKSSYQPHASVDVAFNVSSKCLFLVFCRLWRFLALRCLLGFWLYTFRLLGALRFGTESLCSSF